MKVYTKTGDNGTTSLYDGTRCNKSSDIFMALGELDELNSRVGVLLADMDIGEGTIDTDPSFLERIETNLRQIQSNIQNINSVLASGKKITKNMISEDITNLENEQVRINQNIEKIKMELEVVNIAPEFQVYLFDQLLTLENKIKFHDHDNFRSKFLEEINHLNNPQNIKKTLIIGEIENQIIKPNITFFGLLGFAFGIFISFFLILIRDFTNLFMNNVN